MSSLSELLEKVESATGPERELDFDIASAFYEPFSGNSFFVTSSIDACVSLVERRLPGYCWQIKHGFFFEATVWSVTVDYEDRPVPFAQHQANAPLAILAAILRAEIAKEAGTK